ncbi:hypothetical protein KQX54_015388 [Cotesia glomerata]|uniref:Uncharacterized protein n=1 Tax=Cotesia glomerata TaxID=32391 RepID=A0AAV7IUI0_COTGL|nr:hypothetical protein KQX54_015388 [Cotesia glomerata]
MEKEGEKKASVLSFQRVPVSQLIRGWPPPPSPPPPPQLDFLASKSGHVVMQHPNPLWRTGFNNFTIVFLSLFVFQPTVVLRFCPQTIRPPLTQINFTCVTLKLMIVTVYRKVYTGIHCRPSLGFNYKTLDVRLYRNPKYPAIKIIHFLFRTRPPICESSLETMLAH